MEPTADVCSSVSLSRALDSIHKTSLHHHQQSLSLELGSVCIELNEDCPGPYGHWLEFLDEKCKEVPL